MASIKDLKKMCSAYHECKKCPMSRELCAPEDLPDNADEIVDKWVAEQPAVEVVCCKDCKYWKQERYASSEVYMNCTRHDRGYGDAQPREAMDFCSYGKRKDNGNG